MNLIKAIELAKATPVQTGGEYFGRARDGRHLRLRSGDVGFSDRDYTLFVLRVRGTVVEYHGPGAGYVVSREFPTASAAWEWAARKADESAIDTDSDILALGRAVDPVLFGRRD